jgi:hypothetical protein
MTLLEVSDYIRILGVTYLVAFAFVTSGLFTGFAISKKPKTKYSEAEAGFRENQFGRGAQNSYPTTSETPREYKSLILVIAIGMAAYFVLSFAEKANSPLLNNSIGVTALVLGFFARRKHLREWEGRPGNLDFACFLVGLAIVLPQI